MVLNRNPDNFFAETEQVAFLPTNIVPGIDFSNDPLLQGLGNAWAHLKVIGYSAGAQPLLHRCGVQPGEGVVALSNKKSVGAFLHAAKNGRIWRREPSLRRPG